MLVHISREEERNAHDLLFVPFYCAFQESGSGGSAPGGLLSGEGIASCGGIGVDGEASGDGSLSNAGSIHGAQGQANASKVRAYEISKLAD